MRLAWSKAAIGSLIALLLSLGTPAVAETWRFALIGDTPYSERERAEVPKMMAAIADHPVAFIAHIGDFKKGSERCDNALFEDRRQLFASSRVPFVYIPGDNEWTDCDRLSNGAYDPQERLAKLRALFWQKDESLGKHSMPVERQPGSYPEHARFSVGPVLFVTLNLPGGNNNWGMTSDPRPEFLARNPVVQAWLKDSFAVARRDKKSAIVLLFQANPSFTHYGQGFPHRGYREFLDTLREETLNFSGQVVAVHGDTHISRVDQPLRDCSGRPIQNFVRVETFGYPIMGWTEGIIDSDATNPLRFITHPWPPASQP
ncbi:hypothetical protein LZ012_11910 [Dechloromonas sp. XY25]|uniref:Calcineurin-like phosphoesterase domain-containing protein n=1 Tax=Dechloromonas hankyongensis TaxID=2908002 RepID=A0ABS9K3G3_9RHOO|nr:hypothetical protein [Dechloromonas hankyongensis]MCG2577698.1 hypothetical protein [Dechloromonas hankyongensis]